MGVTITQLARDLGLSAATVSNVLNGKGKRFSEETNRRVLQAAKEQGYRPNAFARAMRTGRFGTIALVVGADRSRCFLPAPLLAGLQMEAERKGIGLNLATIDLHQADQAVPRFIRENATDGLLLNIHKGMPAHVQDAIDQAGLPCLWINDRARTPELAPADRHAAREGTELLIARGHKRIGYLNLYFGGHGGHHESVPQRESGYREAMQAAGLEADVCINSAEPYFSNWGRIIRPWLERAERPTAVLCYAPVIANALLQEARGMGLSIPGELSVLTFSDDDPFSSACPADQLQVPWHDIGQRAVQALDAAVSKREHDAGPAPAFAYTALGTISEAL